MNTNTNHKAPTIGNRNRHVLVVVDVQNDFTEGGALPVNGGKEVARRIEGVLDDNNYDAIVFTQDWHTPGDDNGGHFAEEPDYVDTWPAHCVAMTNGADFAFPLKGTYLSDKRMLIDDRSATFHKGQGAPAYSGAQGTNPRTGMSFLDFFTGDDIVDVVGLAFDYCVKATAVDLAPVVREVRVFADYTASINDPAEATAAMVASGVEVVPATMPAPQVAGDGAGTGN